MACASAKSLLSSSSDDWNWMCSSPGLSPTPGGRSGNRWRRVSGSTAMATRAPACKPRTACRRSARRAGFHAADVTQPSRQALLSPPLHLEIGTIADLFQLRDQFGPIDQKRPPRLIPAEAAYQVDSAPPAPAKKRRLYHFILSGSSLIHTS